MNTPPMLVGCALLFWGWQSGLMPLAAVFAAVLEGSRFVRERWNFSQADLNRIVSLCAFLVFAALGMALISNQGMGLLDAPPRMNSFAARAQTLNKTARSFLLFCQWTPIVFFPIIAAQAYSQASAMSFVSFSAILRRRVARDPAFDPGSVNVSYPFFGVCIVAASATAARGPWFYPAMILLLVWALWSHRVKRFAPAVVIGVIVLVCAGGYAGNHGIRELQVIATRLDSVLMSRFSGREFNPREHRSLLGAVGRLKKSGKIVLWVKNQNGGPPPPLLREASYDQFTSPVWHISNRDFEYTLPENDQTSWTLAPGRPAHGAVRITRMIPGGRGLLAFPNGTALIENLAVFTMQTNAMGVLRVHGPGLVTYDARYARGAGIDVPPTPEDLRVPIKEAEVIAQVASALHLDAIAAANTNRAIETLENFFRRHFSYSVFLESQRHRSRTNTAIGRFLLESRKGHCEYFAAATVLLLREAGIPARYAVGYSVQEGAKGSYVVRERHAHAWCLAWVNGAWMDIDTTPPNWNTIESQRAPWWEPVSDAWSKIWLQFSRLRWNLVNYKRFIFWGMIPAVFALGVLIYRRRQWSRVEPAAVETNGTLPGLDSEFYLIEARLNQLGFARHTGEPLGLWLQRVNGSVPRNGVPLEALLKLHYRYRFDPDGLGEGERERLRSSAAEVVRSLARHDSSRTEHA